VWSLEDASIRTERQGTPWRRICLHGALHRSAELSPAAPVLLLPTSPEACVEDAPGAWAHPTATAAAAATTAIISRRELHGHLVERGQGQLTGQGGGRACAGVLAEVAWAVMLRAGGEGRRRREKARGTAGMCCAGLCHA